MTRVDRRRAEIAAAMTEIGKRLGARTGHMFGFPALYAGRRLAVCTDGSGLGVKLPVQRVSELIDTGRATNFRPYNRPPMREWAHLPASTGHEVGELTHLIAEALEFAHTP